jgi:hypothetical protein
LTVGKPSLGRLRAVADFVRRLEGGRIQCRVDRSFRQRVVGVLPELVSILVAGYAAWRFTISSEDSSIRRLHRCLACARFQCAPPQLKNSHGNQDKQTRADYPEPGQARRLSLLYFWAHRHQQLKFSSPRHAPRCKKSVRAALWSKKWQGLARKWQATTLDPKENVTW